MSVKLEAAEPRVEMMNGATKEAVKVSILTFFAIETKFSVLSLFNSI